MHAYRPDWTYIVARPAADTLIRADFWETALLFYNNLTRTFLHAQPALNALIFINHGNGYQTMYAHMSGVAVSRGQSVEKGQLIGFMGSSGRSTGTHLHFEVYVNGVRVNPYNYVG